MPSRPSFPKQILGAVAGAFAALVIYQVFTVATPALQAVVFSQVSSSADNGSVELAAAFAAQATEESSSSGIATIGEQVALQPSLTDLSEMQVQSNTSSNQISSRTQPSSLPSSGVKERLLIPLTAFLAVLLYSRRKKSLTNK